MTPRVGQSLVQGGLQAAGVPLQMSPVAVQSVSTHSRQPFMPTAQVLSVSPLHWVSPSAVQASSQQPMVPNALQSAAHAREPPS